jgi:adenylate kinase
MVSQQIAGSAATGAFILDGYPRTTDQVRHLDALQATLGVPAAAVVALTVEPEELIPRLLHRAQSSGRSDDTEAIIRQRQAVYLHETAPLLALYRHRGVLWEVDGMGEPADVADRIDAALASDAARRIDAALVDLAEDGVRKSA